MGVFLDGAASRSLYLAPLLGRVLRRPAMGTTRGPARLPFRVFRREFLGVPTSAPAFRPIARLARSRLPSSRFSLILRPILPVYVTHDFEVGTSRVPHPELLPGQR